MTTDESVGVILGLVCVLTPFVVWCLLMLQNRRHKPQPRQSWHVHSLRLDDDGPPIVYGHMGLPDEVHDE
jgi:hypothetical protein